MTTSGKLVRGIINTGSAMARKQGGDQCANLLGLFWKIKTVAFMKIAALWNFLPRDGFFLPQQKFEKVRDSE